MSYEHWIIKKYPCTAWLDSSDLDYWANEHGWLLISAVIIGEDANGVFADIGEDTNTQIYTFRREVKGD